MNNRAYINQESCNHSKSCQAKDNCAKEAINYEEGRLYINQFCNGCGKCKKYCANDAIELV